MSTINKKLIIIIAVLVIVEAALVLLCNYAYASTFVCCVHKGEVVWVRDAPSKEACKVASIRYGHEVDISEIVNQYGHATLKDGSTGWVDISYFEKPIPEEIWLVNTKDPLNKRETPDGRYLTRIKGGSRISVLAWRYSPSGELWAKCFHGGYVNAKFLSKAE